MLAGTVGGFLVEGFKRRLDFTKRDSTGEAIKPGDMCLYTRRQGSERIVEFCIYIGDTKGNGSTGNYGQFKTTTGKRSLKYSNIIFAFDPLGERRNQSEQVKEIIRKYYEDK